MQPYKQGHCAEWPYKLTSEEDKKGFLKLFVSNSNALSIYFQTLVFIQQISCASLIISSAMKCKVVSSSCKKIANSLNQKRKKK